MNGPHYGSNAGNNSAHYGSQQYGHSGQPTHASASSSSAGPYANSNGSNASAGNTGNMGQQQPQQVFYYQSSPAGVPAQSYYVSAPAVSTTGGGQPQHVQYYMTAPATGPNAGLAPSGQSMIYQASPQQQSALMYAHQQVS
jgi:hypothetical protein